MGKEKNKIAVLNNPIEHAIKIIVALKCAMAPLTRDRLVAYEYFALHLSDLNEKAESLFPRIPYRACTYVCNHTDINMALEVLLSRDLIKYTVKNNRLCYALTEAGSLFEGYLQNEYKRQLTIMMAEVVSLLKDKSDMDIQEYVERNIGKWGSEFEREYTLIKDASHE